MPPACAFYSEGPACRHKHGDSHAVCPWARRAALAQNSVFLPAQHRGALVFPCVA